MFILLTILLLGMSYIFYGLYTHPLPNSNIIFAIFKFSLSAYVMKSNFLTDKDNFLMYNLISSQLFFDNMWNKRHGKKTNKHQYQWYRNFFYFPMTE